MMETAESALDACERIAAIGVLVFSLEWMYLRRELHSDRLLAWDVLGLRDGWSTSRAVDLVLRDARLWYLQVVRAAMKSTPAESAIGVPIARLEAATMKMIEAI